MAEKSPKDAEHAVPARYDRVMIDDFLNHMKIEMEVAKKRNEHAIYLLEQGMSAQEAMYCRSNALTDVDKEVLSHYREKRPCQLIPDPVFRPGKLEKKQFREAVKEYLANDLLATEHFLEQLESMLETFTRALIASQVPVQFDSDGEVVVSDWGNIKINTDGEIIVDPDRKAASYRAVVYPILDGDMSRHPEDEEPYDDSEDLDDDGE